MALSEDLVIVSTSIAPGTSTASQLYSSSTDERVVSFIVQADEGNSGDIYLGDASVSANNSFTLDAKDSLSFNPIEPTGMAPHMYNLNSFYALASASGDRLKIITVKLNKQV